MATITSAEAETGSSPPLKRNKFLLGLGGESNVGKKGEVQKGIKSPEIRMPERPSLEYREFVNNYLQGLLDLDRRDPANLQTLLNAQGHEHDRMLFERLTTAVNRDGTVSREINQEAINTLLSVEEGWGQVTMLMEHKIILKSFALGLQAAVTPAGDRDLGMRKPWAGLGRKNYRGMSIPIEDQGAIIKFLDKASEKSAQISIGLTSAAAGGAVGSLFGPIGTAAGLGIGIAAPFIGHEMRPGVSINLDQCVAAYQSLSRNASPAEIEYIRIMTGVDLGDFEPDTNPVSPNRIRLRQNKTQGTVDTLPNLARSLSGDIDTRRKYFEALGVPTNQVDAVSEQFLFRWTDGQPEKLSGVKWHDELMNNYFRPDTQGIQDSMHRPRNNPNFMRGPNVTLDIEGNLRRFREARVKFMADLGQRIFGDLENKSNYRRDYGTIDRKIAQLSDPATEKTRRSQNAVETRKRLETERTNFNTEESARDFSAVDQRQQAIQGLEDLLRDNIRDWQRRLNTQINFTLNQQNQLDFEGTVTAVINRFNQELNGAQNAPGLVASLAAARQAYDNQFDQITNTRLQQQAQAMVVQIQQQQQNIAAAIVPPEIAKQLREEVRDQRMPHTAEGRRLEEAQNEVNRRKEAITQLEDLLTQYRTAGRELQKAQSEATNNLPRQELRDIQEAFESFVYAGASTISEADLQDASITNEDLINRATQPPYNLPNNTPEEQQELRIRVIRARAEAQARQIESWSPVANSLEYSQLITAINVIRLPGALTSTDLLRMPEQQLLARLSQPPYNNIPAIVQLNAVDRLDYIRRAQQAARSMLVTRHRQFVEQRLADFDGRIRDLSRTIDDPNLEQTITNDRIGLEITRDVMNNQAGIFDRFTRDIDQPPPAQSRFNTYLNATLLDQNNPNRVNYSAFETAEYQYNNMTANLPEGYVLIMRDIFQYQHRTDLPGNLSPEQFFRQIVRTIPPDQFAAFVNDYYFGVNQQNRTDINAAFAAMRHEISGRAPGMRGVRARELLQAFINNRRQEAVRV